LAKESSSGILEHMEAQHRQGPIYFRRPWILGLLGLLFVVQLVIPSRVWTILLVSLGGAVGLGYLWARQLARNLHIVREQHYGWAHVGDLLEERFELHNASFFPALWIEIDDQSDLPGYTARSVRGAGGQETIHWRTEGLCRQRGIFTLGPWQVRCSDPFGFFDVLLKHDEARSILIYPPIVHLPGIQLPKGAATGSGRTSQTALQPTTNAAGVRAYAPGESLNRIHWRTSARLQTLMVKTFDLEPSGDLWIVLDLDASVQSGEDEESTEEYGVILACSLADRALKQNRAVGLIAYGSTMAPDGPTRMPLPTIILPQKGHAQQWRILEALASVRAGGHWPLAKVLAEMDRNLGRGMTLAVITPSCDRAWAAGLLPPMRRGVAPTVLLLDAVTFAAGESGDEDRKGAESEIQAMTSLLADLGVPSHRIAQGMPFQPIEVHKRIGRPEFKVLPGTGRVIRVDP
jgi:uncharacterized protein (DUF58 family)